MIMELLYQTDSYKQNLNTKILAIDVDKNAVQLESTIFYPGGGGQPTDHGWIDFDSKKHPILKTERDGKRLWYIIKGAIPEVDDKIQLHIDWERRYQLMRTHTAMHILCGVIWRDYQAQVTGGNMEPLSGRMDFEFENMSRDLVNDIEEKINLEVQNSRDIEVRILPREEANNIPDLIRTKINLLPPHLKEIRTVEIKGLDLQADGGTHVKNTSEVGKIRITDYKSKGRINKRLKIQLD
jgi:misacylated tRNA(Ala) deacylase